VSRIFLLDGPSGTGKSTLVQRLLAECKDTLEFCPRLTTRAPRGVEPDYQFVTPERFEELRAQDAFAAHRSFEFGMSYGLPRAGVETALSHGHDVLALIDLGTLEQARRVWPQAVGIFLISPLDELRQRLVARAMNTSEQIEERLRNAELALKLAPAYDFVVVNRQDRLEQSLDQLRWIVSRPAG